MPPEPHHFQDLVHHDGQPILFIQKEWGTPGVWRRDRVSRCIETARCACCGKPLAKFRSAVFIGLSDVVNRLTALPLMHTSCALWFVQSVHVPPGAVATAESHTAYNLIENEGASIIFAPGIPTAMAWWRAGQQISRDEVFDALSQYETAAIELAEDANERTGLNFTMHSICEMVADFFASVADAAPAQAQPT